MFSELMKVPDIIVTNAVGNNGLTFEFWQRTARIDVIDKCYFMMVTITDLRCSSAWISEINLQLTSSDYANMLALQWKDNQLWVVQHLPANWQAAQHEDRQKLVFHFAVADWLEQEARRLFASGYLQEE